MYRKKGMDLNEKDNTELTLQETLARLRLTDDEMMRTALQDQEGLMQYILRVILRKPDLTILRMEVQKDLRQFAQKQPLALAVWAVDSGGTNYDIEVRRTFGGADEICLRYYTGSGMNVLRTEGDPQIFPEMRSIFIAEMDCFGDGRLLHQLCMQDRRYGTRFEPGQEILYLNTAFDGAPEQGEEEIAALAHDFRCTDPADMILEPLADRMRFLKNTEKGRAKMSSIVEQYARQQAEKAAEKAAAEERQKMEKKIQGTVRKLVAAGKHTPEEIADITGLSFDEVQTICGSGNA